MSYDYDDDNFSDGTVDIEGIVSDENMDIIDIKKYPFPELEGKLTAAERKDLPKRAFGLPDKLKFPLYLKDPKTGKLYPDKEHIKDAKGYFRYAKGRDKVILADNILKADRKLPGNKKKVYKVDTSPWYKSTTEYKLNILLKKREANKKTNLAEVEDVELPEFFDLEADAETDLLDKSNDSDDDESTDDDSGDEESGDGGDGEEEPEEDDEGGDSDDSDNGEGELLDASDDSDPDPDDVEEGDEGDGDGGEEGEEEPEEDESELPFKSRSVKRIRIIESGLQDLLVTLNERLQKDNTDKTFEDLIALKSTVEDHLDSANVLIEKHKSFSRADYFEQANILIEAIGGDIANIGQILDDSDKEKPETDVKVEEKE